MATQACPVRHTQSSQCMLSARTFGDETKEKMIECVIRMICAINHSHAALRLALDLDTNV